MAPKNKKKTRQPKSKKTRAPKQTFKKRATKKATPAKKVALRRKKALRKKSGRGKSEGADTVVFQPRGLGARSGGQSGDLQDLSNREGADSESVGELLEEGNAFEAEIVKGIEDVPDADEGEVRTHEVPEDDVPEEYLDKDL
jgi:hypothetical protein